MTNENREDAPVIEHEEICDFIAEKTDLDCEQIDIVLEHGVEFIMDKIKTKTGSLELIQPNKLPI